MNQKTKIDIRNLTLEEVTAGMASWGEKPFRARQVYQWLWQKRAVRFEDMTNLSISLRQKLDEQYQIRAIREESVQRSSDGTIKSRFQLHDGPFIEGVLIPAKGRLTACVSSQAGCSLNCSFCATGYLPLKRNLQAAEIFDQVVLLNQQALQYYQSPLTNIVYMGMGEPLLNYRNVLRSIHHLCSPEGLNMSPGRITVSTAGIAKMIKKLGDDKVRFNLALSLHATTDAKRNEIMPINESNKLSVLVEALNYFYQKTRNRITFEYILLRGVNDSLDDARRLWRLCQRVPARVNLIEYNPIEQATFDKSQVGAREEFANFLASKKVIAKLRRSRGKDIDAACGQLANK